MVNTQRLTDILSMRRAHNSFGEQAFIDTYLTPLEPMAYMNNAGEALAYVVVIDKRTSDKDTEPRDANNILWSCHIDTMHSATPELTQEIWIDDLTHTAFVTDKSDCLGADDGAGVWLLLEMIDAGVEGTYIFHRGEERGCWGSGQMVDLYPDWLEGFTHAIAFDRRGTTSIITHQRGERACSEQLSKAFAGLLKLGHTSDPTGIYTDTAEYMHLIPECVNVSIGYEHEHGSSETLDIDYVLSLRNAMVSVDWVRANLPVSRDKNILEYDDNWSYAGYRVTGLQPDSLLDPYNIPSLKDLLKCRMTDIEDWIDETRTENVAYLINDLVDLACQAMYHADEDDDDDTDMYLKAGMM